MGAWGHRPFDNDTALDFANDFRMEGPAVVERALDTVITSEEYLEAPDAETAIAAAAFIATADGHANWLSETAREAFETHPDKTALLALKAKAQMALKRIQQPNSEWMELWEEADGEDYDAAKRSLEQLISDLD